jgi:hypothetical protein
MLAVRPVTSLLLAASTGASATAAEACVVSRDFDETAFLEADLIFIGDLTDYNIVTVQGEFHDTELAVLTYRVDQVLKGGGGRQNPAPMAEFDLRTPGFDEAHRRDPGCSGPW